MQCVGIYCKCDECKKILDWSIYIPQAKAAAKFAKKLMKIKKPKK